MISKININKGSLISLIRAKNPMYKTDDIERIVDSLEDVIIDSLNTGHKVKLGKIVSLTPVIKPAQRHYNGAAKLNGGKAEFIQIPSRLRIKITKLQKVKELETKKM